MKAGLGLCPASWALPYLRQFDPHPTLRPVMRHSIGPWEPPVPVVAARIQSTHLKPQAVPRSPWRTKETLGLDVTTDGRKVSREQAQRTPVDEGPVALGLPRRDTNWHEMDELPSWTCLVSSQTGPRDFSSPNDTALCLQTGRMRAGVLALRKRTPGVGTPVMNIDMWVCHSEREASQLCTQAVLANRARVRRDSCCPPTPNWSQGKELWLRKI